MSLRDLFDLYSLQVRPCSNCLKSVILVPMTVGLVSILRMLIVRWRRHADDFVAPLSDAN